MRNIGDRITPGLLEQLGLLGRIGEVAGEIPGGGGEFHLIVLQHTDCGITRLAGDPSLLAHYFQIGEGKLKTKSVSDPRQTYYPLTQSARRAQARSGQEAQGAGEENLKLKRLVAELSLNCPIVSHMC